LDTLPSFPALTPDDQIWRLDWFGECAYPGSVRRYAQPSVRVGLSTLRCDPSDHAALTSPDGTDHQHQHETWVPIAALPMLAIGDLWQNGHQIGSPNYQVESFKNLHIHSGSANFVKAGLAIDEHFLLPLSSHPWHRLYTQSYCVAVTLNEQRHLLVPCIELIRFYFGSSSNFLQKLFTEHLTPEALWSSKHLNPSNWHLHLVLANHLSGASATDIGRVAESKLAWRAASGIYTSCQKASATGHPAYPYTGFPFEGTTDLVASGIWLPFGEQERATFLVYRLRSCSHPFPFQSLSYEAGDRKVRHAASSCDRKVKPENAAYSGTTHQKMEVAETDPGSRKAQRACSFKTPRRFPDLVRKQVWREKIETLPNSDVFLLDGDGHLEQIAFGNSSGSSTTPGMDLAQSTGNEHDKPGETTLPWFVRAGLRDISADPAFASPEVNTKMVYPDSMTNPVFTLPMVIDENGVIADGQLFLKADGSTRQRRGCFVEIIRAKAHQSYLLVLEGGSRHKKPTLLPTETVDVKAALRLKHGHQV
jgi:hypothetical protein